MGGMRLTMGYEAIRNQTAKPMGGKPKCKAPKGGTPSVCRVLRPDGDGNLRLVQTVSPAKPKRGLYERDYGALIGPTSLAKGETRKKRWGTL